MADTRDYHILSPVSSHFRPASCAEVGCADYERGWRTCVPSTADEMLALARSSGRRYIERETGDGSTEFIFEAGQPCFRSSQHRVSLQRPAIHVIRDGRASQPKKVGSQAWHDNLGEHLDNIRTLQERG